MPTGNFLDKLILGSNTTSSNAASRVVAASGGFTAAQAVMMKTTGEITKANASSLSLNLTHAGLAITAGTPGATATFITHGPIDSGLISLGVGAAVAVGTDTNGNPVRVTDAACVSGLKQLGWCDATGTIYIQPNRPEKFSSIDYGCFGNGTTDDLSSAQACLNAAALVGGIAYFPATGHPYKLVGQLTIPSNVKITGDHAPTGENTTQGSMWLFSGSGAGMIINGVNDFTFDSIEIFGDATSGPEISLPTGAAACSYLRFPKLTIIKANPATAAIQFGSSGANNGVEADPVRFGSLTILSAPSQSVPVIALYGVGGGLNNVSFEDLTIFGGDDSHRSTAEFVHVESTDTGVVSNIDIDRAIFEIPWAGAVHFYSVRNSRLGQIWAGDLSSNNPTAPTFYFAAGAHTSNTHTFNILIESIQSDMGKTGTPTLLTDGLYTNNIKIMCGSVPWIGNGGPGLNPIAIDNAVIGGHDGDAPVGWIAANVANADAYQTNSQDFQAHNGANVDIVTNIYPVSIIRIKTGSLSGSFAIDSVYAGLPGQRMTIYNPTSFDMTITDQSDATTSTPANKIVTMTGADVVVPHPGVADFYYDPTGARWILISARGSGGPV